MIDKLLDKSEVCFTLGHPTPLGYLLLIILVIIAFVGWAIAKKR